MPPESSASRVGEPPPAAAAPHSEPRIGLGSGRAVAWIKSFVVATVAVYAAYLLAANVILRTHLLRDWLRADDGTLVITYASARSLYPGHVVLDDLGIRFRDENLQMWIGIERTTLDIGLARLVRRTAHFENVKAEGVVYRLRTTLDKPPEDDRRSKAFPPIEGFASPPVREAVEKGGGKPWTIEVRDVVGSVREVWAMEYRFHGSGNLSGGFRISPHREISVAPSMMTTDAGVLALGNDDLVRGEGWRLDAELHPFQPDDVHGIEVLKFLSFAVHQRGDVISVTPAADVYLPRDTRVSGGAGPLAVDVHVDRGILQPDARVTYRTDDVRFRDGDLAGHGDVEIVASVESSPEGPFLRAVASSARAGMAPATALRDVRVEADVTGLDATGPVSLERLALGVEGAHVANVHAWQPIVGPSVRLASGGLTASARGEYRRGAITGRVDAKLEKVALGAGPFSAVASGTTATNITGRTDRLQLAFPGARVDLTDLSVKLLDGHAEGMWLKATSGDVRTVVAGRSDADIQVLSGPGDQAMKLFTRMASIPDLAADVTHGRELAALVHLGVHRGTVTLDIEAARNGAIATRGRLQKPEGRGLAGALLVGLGPVGIGLSFREGDVSVRPLAGKDWLTRKTPDAP